MRKTLLLLIPITILLLGATKNKKEQVISVDHSIWADIAQDTFNVQEAIAEIREKIKGRENEPAGEVFGNVKMFGQMPAARILGVMQMGFSRSLGVNCTHCHNPKDWASDEKPAKQIARDMMAMSQKINGEMLPDIANLQGAPAVINCTTCHRGQVIPATNLE